MKITSLTLPNNEKLGLISNLSTMVNAGLTMSEAIDSLIPDATGNLKNSSSWYTRRYQSR